MTMPQLIPLLIFIAVVIIVWIIAERFSPDPLITKIIQIVLFIVVIVKALSLLGVA